MSAPFNVILLRELGKYNSELAGKHGIGHLGECYFHSWHWAFYLCSSPFDLLILTGVITVRSGKWLPPAHGWLLSITSPFLMASPNTLIYSYIQHIIINSSDFNLCSSISESLIKNKNGT